MASHTFEILGLRTPPANGGLPVELEGVLRKCKAVDALLSPDAGRPEQRIPMLYYRFNTTPVFAEAVAGGDETISRVLDAVHAAMWVTSRMQTEDIERACEQQLNDMGVSVPLYGDYKKQKAEAIARLARLLPNETAYHRADDVDHASLMRLRESYRRKVERVERQRRVENKRPSFFKLYDRALLDFLRDPANRSAGSKLFRDAAAAGEKAPAASALVLGKILDAGASNKIQRATLGAAVPEAVILRSVKTRKKTKEGETGTLLLEGLYQFALNKLHDIPIQNADGMHVIPLFETPIMPAMKMSGVSGMEYVQMMSDADKTLMSFLAEKRIPHSGPSVMFSIVFQMMGFIQRCDFFLGMLHNDLHLSNICVNSSLRDKPSVHYMGKTLTQDFSLSLIDLGRATFLWKDGYTCMYGKQQLFLKDANGNSRDVYPLNQRIDDVKSFLCHLGKYTRHPHDKTALSEILEYIDVRVRDYVDDRVRRDWTTNDIHVELRTQTYHDDVFEPKYILDRLLSMYEQRQAAEQVRRETAAAIFSGSGPRPTGLLPPLPSRGEKEPPPPLPSRGEKEPPPPLSSRGEKGRPPPSSGAEEAAREVQETTRERETRRLREEVGRVQPLTETASGHPATVGYIGNADKTKPRRRLASAPAKQAPPPERAPANIAPTERAALEDTLQRLTPQPQPLPSREPNLTPLPLPGSPDAPIVRNQKRPATSPLVVGQSPSPGKSGPAGPDAATDEWWTGQGYSPAQGPSRQGPRIGSDISGIETGAGAAYEMSEAGAVSGTVQDPEDALLASLTRRIEGEEYDSQDSTGSGKNYTSKGKEPMSSYGTKQSALAQLEKVLQREAGAAAAPEPRAARRPDGPPRPVKDTAPPGKETQGSLPDIMAWLRANYDDSQV